MKTPFIFGRVVTDTSFINRTSEISRLENNFKNHVNTILISPRRWGKSSLVKKTTLQLNQDDSNLIFCFLDLFRIRSENEFYKQYASQVIKSTSGKLDDWIRSVKDLLGRLSTNISFGTDPVNDFQISFGLANGELDKEEILNLPEKIAQQKNKHIVVLIDEFQNIMNYPESVDFQRLLRSVWQHHENVSYCIYGSKRHMMMELFESQSMPFYKFGELMFLEKIGKNHFVEFITNSFALSSKFIDPVLCEKVYDLVDGHPYFVQQLAHVLWGNTDMEVTELILENSVKDVLAQNSILYQEIINMLSINQLSYLVALSKGVENLSSKDVLNQYELGTSANVSKIRKALINKEIIDINHNQPEFTDPFFRIFLQSNFY